MQLAATRYLEFLRVDALLHAQRHVVDEFALEAILDLAGRQVLAPLATVRSGVANVGHVVEPEVIQDRQDVGRRFQNDRPFRCIDPGKEIDIQDLPALSHENMKVEVENCLAALKQIGMDVFLIDTMHADLQIPAFYTIIPGAHFRERALATSVGMFAAKHIAENQSPHAAIGELSQIDRDLPGKYYVKFYLGSCHLTLNEPKTALKCFEQALNLEPNPQDVPSIYSYLGVALKDMGEYRRALDVLRKGIDLDPERTDILNLMGFCHFKLEEHEAAIENFKKIIQLDPSSAIDYANIASNYRDMGQTAKAIRYYEMALTLDASIEFARENLARLKSPDC